MIFTPMSPTHLQFYYFKPILKNSKKNFNLALCLEGVSKQDLNNCLDYMYNGEVQIYQDELDRFLNIAKRFQIKGLLNTDKKDEEAEEYDVIDDVKQEIELRHQESLTQMHLTENFLSKAVSPFIFFPRLQNYF